jgi:hypothetical protein
VLPPASSVAMLAPTSGGSSAANSSSNLHAAAEAGLTRQQGLIRCSKSRSGG